jgi:hypothetical protein
LGRVSLLDILAASRTRGKRFGNEAVSPQTPHYQELIASAGAAGSSTAPLGLCEAHEYGNVNVARSRRHFEQID